MPQSEKPVVISFRADSHLAELLGAMPDKSAFIRKAILSHFHQSCPLCKGRGVVPDPVAKWLANKLSTDHAIECECCEYDFPEPATITDPDHFLCDHCQAHHHEHFTSSN